MEPARHGFDLGCCWETVRGQRLNNAVLGNTLAACEEAARGPDLTAEVLETVRRRFWFLPRWQWYSSEDAERLVKKGRGLLDLLRRDVPAGMERILSVQGDLVPASVVARFAHPARCAILSGPVAEFFDPVRDLKEYLRFLDQVETVRAAQENLPSASSVGEALYQLNREMLGLLERDGLRPCPRCRNTVLLRDGIRDLLDRHGGSPRPQYEMVPPEHKPRFARQFLEFVEGTAALRADTKTRFIGVSFGRVRAFWKVVRATRASKDTGILLLGPPGSGKEPLARAAHDHCPERRNGPFHAVSGANLRGPLAETELFGHRRGAFTGAIGERLGAFRQAHRGTLFLDEIGDLSPEVQSALLRTLQERVVRPLGTDGTSVPVDVRVVAATNRNLHRAMTRGEFREDLFDRLAVEVVDVPGLRREDVNLPALLDTLLRRMEEGRGRSLVLTQGAREMLSGHDWPGNVRELMATLERAANRLRRSAIDETAVQEALEAGRRGGEVRDALDGDGPPKPSRVGESEDPPPYGPPQRPAAPAPRGLLPPEEAVRAWFSENPAARGDTSRFAAMVQDYKRALLLALAREGRHRRTLGEVARIVGATQTSLAKFLGEEALERVGRSVYIRDGAPPPAP